MWNPVILVVAVIVGLVSCAVLERWGRDMSAAVGRLPLWVQTVRRRRPLRRFLRRRSVLTLLGFAGVILSASALLILIGVGNVQIQAAHGGSRDLFTDPWFDVGVVLGCLGISWGIVAASANGSQAKARREFPDVSIHFLSWLLSDVNRVLQPSGAFFPLALSRFTVRIVNREPTRTASLSMLLWWDLKPGAPGNASSWPFADVRWDLTDLATPPLDRPYDPLPIPILLAPGATIQGDWVTSIPGQLSDRLDRDSPPRVDVTDHFSERTVTFEASLAVKHDQSNWTNK
jgi:hypothetical protein